jgi:hypothetical protein
MQNTEIQTGSIAGVGSRGSELNGNYKAERSQEQYKMQIIDPKVTSHAHIPAHIGSMPSYGKKMADDFPSQHGKRSLLKLDPLEQRRLKVWKVVSIIERKWKAINNLS